jgi:hypothetical protein
MRKLLLVCFTVIITVGISTSIVRAFSVGSGPLEVDSIKIGKQGVGGVTFFNGSIINNTTGKNNFNNPITFADNVRIDGEIYRTEPGPDDSPLKITDNVNIYGGLTVNDNIKANKIYASDLYYDNNSVSSKIASLTSVNTTQTNSINSLKSTISTINSVDYAQNTLILAHQNQIYHIANYLACVGFASQYTTYLESDDTISCWNTWMAGVSFPATGSSMGASIQSDYSYEVSPEMHHQ